MPALCLENPRGEGATLRRQGLVLPMAAEIMPGSISARKLPLEPLSQAQPPRVSVRFLRAAAEQTETRKDMGDVTTVFTNIFMLHVVHFNFCKEDVAMIRFIWQIM